MCESGLHALKTECVCVCTSDPGSLQCVSCVKSTWSFTNTAVVCVCSPSPQVFVCLVVALTCSVVVIVYLCVLPVILNTYPLHRVLGHLCYGHWNLIMVAFHYYKATSTSPGHPPQVRTHTHTHTM